MPRLFNGYYLGQEFDGIYLILTEDEHGNAIKGAYYESYEVLPTFGKALYIYEHLKHLKANVWRGKQFPIDNPQTWEDNVKDWIQDFFKHAKGNEQVLNQEIKFVNEMFANLPKIRQDHEDRVNWLIETD